MVQDRLGQSAAFDSIVCVWKLVYVKSCVCERAVGDKVVCKSLCVKELYVTKLRVRVCMCKRYV